nr:response regulator [Geotalea toluenoxydans]
MESARILIADDDKKTRDFVAAFLSYKGYQVFQAGDGQDALEKIELNDVQMVITDIMMPRIKRPGIYQKTESNATGDSDHRIQRLCQL